MDLCNVWEVRALLDRYGVRPSKARGQNFLIAPWVPAAIAEACGADRQHGVLEIGPGVGCLTAELCQRAGSVVSVELDRGLLPVLRETMAGVNNFTLLSGDVRKLDLRKVVEEHFVGLRPMACANLPYNITAPVLTALIDSKCFASITVMIQREVAQRLTAQPGTGAYGAFSVYVQYYTDPELLFTVSPACFLPAPKVTSAVVRCRKKPDCHLLRCEEPFFFRVVRGAFAQRRKTLANALCAAFPELSKGTLSACIAHAGFSPAIRGETLGVAEFARLADEIFTALPSA